MKLDSCHADLKLLTSTWFVHFILFLTHAVSQYYSSHVSCLRRIMSQLKTHCLTSKNESVLSYTDVQFKFVMNFADADQHSSGKSQKLINLF